MQASSRSLRLMGTIIETRIWHPQAEPILDQVEELLYLYKDRFSANDLTSELMEVNLNAGVQAVPVADDLYELITLGKEHSLAQGSFLNITIGPLVQSWRIGFSDAKLPTQAIISEKLQLINPRDIELDDQEHTVYLRKEGKISVFGMISDQSPWVGNINHWNTFLNQDTPVITGTEQLAKKFDYPVFYIHIHRVKRGYYKFEYIHVSLEPTLTSEFEISNKYMEILEQKIKAVPEYWLWTHNRWKHSHLRKK